MTGDVSEADLATPGYHVLLRDYLKGAEPELWSWFREVLDPDRAAVEQAELELLKATYRLDGDAHAVLRGTGRVLAKKLGLGEELVLYQDLLSAERNVRVLRFGDRIHVVFSGNVLEILNDREHEAVLAHELAHIALHDREGQDFRILDHLVNRADVEAITNDVIGETARRLRLHTEVFADAVALELLGEPSAVVSSFVKVSTGLRNVDPDAYLRQASQIIEADPSSSHGWTHPELHVRVACLAAHASGQAHDIVSRLIDGPDDLDRIDLLGQIRLQRLAGRVLASARSFSNDQGVRSYMRNYPALPALAKDRIGDGELTDCSPSVRYLAGALLADVALLDPGKGLIQALSREADRQGVAAEYDKVLSRATKQTLAEVRKLRSPS